MQMKIGIFLLLFPLQLWAQSGAQEMARWKNHVNHVQIIRDEYGVPHIYGHTDADAVFGLLYAQCEDDFKRVEMNYIEKLGRLAEVNGAADLYNDLLIKLVIHEADAKKDFQQSPLWLQKLCIAFADGINYFLYKNPQVKPALLTRFEPWFPLLWTDGSIGAINTAGFDAGDLKHFYTGQNDLLAQNPEPYPENTNGSNGFAFAPSITQNKHAILYINPHVTFYFRPEVHMVSNEGLNAYGAVTWGQFFIYQGFNSFCGWMHTSSYVDAADAYIEKISRQSGRYQYKYNGRMLPVKIQNISLAYKTPAGMAQKNFTGYFTHHGPIMAIQNNHWISVRADNRIKEGLIQCWQRTKAGSFHAFKKTLDLKGNISNNTVYADADGNIAYWHGNRIPKRDTAYNWALPVDGSIKATEWKGYHRIAQTVHGINPPNGWLQNCNATPFTVAGNYSPLKKDYPAYMAPDAENFRGINAVSVLNETRKYNLEKVIAAGYDTRLTAFEVLVPALIKAFDSLEPNDSLYALKAAIDTLRQWDYRSGENSVATSIAIAWGQLLLPAIAATHLPAGMEANQVNSSRYFAQTATALQLLQPLQQALEQLIKNYGGWQKPWGNINRFQRISSSIEPQFSDAAPSYPVAFAGSVWGQLPSYSSRSFKGTVNRYGLHGNSFVCAVEFGPRIIARSLLAGGNSGHPESPHFFDQGLMYSKGQFKEVHFYKEDVLKNAKRTYRPGE